MLRLDRFLTLYFFKHLAKIYPPPKGIRIPILMYHSISDEKEKGHPYYWINTSPRRFSEQMGFLHDNNYKVISLSDAVRIIESGNSSNSVNSSNPINPSNQYVVLTFDDGYKDFHTYAFPVLVDYGFKATVYLPTGVIDKKESNLRGKPHLNWTEIRELNKCGISFGSHTVTHRQLSELDEISIKWELKVSKERIEEETGKKVEDFSYPYRFPEQDKGFIGRLEGWLKQEGYIWANTTSIGTIHHSGNIFWLKRIPVNLGDDLRFFSAKIKGAYDWVCPLQQLFKRIKTNASNLITMKRKHIYYR